MYNPTTQQLHTHVQPYYTITTHTHMYNPTTQ